MPKLQKEADQTKMILDVGCGQNPRGDVNCDLYPQDIGHRTGKETVQMGKIKARNFVQCDVTKLPFRNDAFTSVYCDNVIEHTKQPYQLFKELLRVTNDHVKIICPHQLGERATLPKNPFHHSYFKVGWFYRAARKNNVNYVSVAKTRYCGFPLNFLPIEITVEIRK